jgi:dTDP-4-dehydrorhamnose reductase
MKILLLGREGQVAWELRRSLAPLGEVIAADRRTPGLTVDLADAGSLRRAIADIQPDLIINAAAYTAVDKAEQESDLAWRINSEAPGIIAAEAQRMGAGLIHYSTDYVFGGGTLTTPYPEHHAAQPQSVYGHSKLAGEQAIQATGVPHLILRTAWVYGRRGHNFLLTMLRLLRERERVTVVDDQLGAPTWSRHIADATALLVACCSQGDRFRPGERAGIYHLTCAGETSWHGFAEQIAIEARSRGLLGDRVAQLDAIPTSGYPTAARRPAYSVLANEKLAEAFGLRLPDWQAALRLCLDDFCKLT